MSLFIHLASLTNGGGTISKNKKNLNGYWYHAKQGCAFCINQTRRGSDSSLHLQKRWSLTNCPDLVGDCDHVVQPQQNDGKNDEQNEHHVHVAFVQVVGNESRQGAFNHA